MRSFWKLADIKNIKIQSYERMADALSSFIALYDAFFIAHCNYNMNLIRFHANGGRARLLFHSRRVLFMIYNN